jgi:hypothetical protein
VNSIESRGAAIYRDVNDVTIFHFLGYYGRVGALPEVPGTWFIDRIVHRDALQRILA